MVGVLVGSIALLADFFLRFTFWGGGAPVAGATNDSGGGGLQIVVFVVAIVLAILAPIMARLVQLAVSRQREYLADASGVELTRNPVGPRAGAGEDRARHGAARGRQPRRPSTSTSRTRSRACRASQSNLFSTHPPVMDRINRLRRSRASRPIEDPSLVLGLASADPTGAPNPSGPPAPPPGPYPQTR